MGLLDKFRKKTAPKPDSVTSGGSNIYRYEEKEEKGWRPPAAFGEYAEEISAHFAQLFPEREETVLHEIFSDLVHIDINIRKPNEKHNYYFIYTTGMSDLPMTLPKGYENREDMKYAELYAFMPPTWNPGDEFQLSTDIPDSEYWIIHMLKFLARFPHEYETWFGAGHTIPNGPDYEPICEGTTMGGVVLSQSGGDLECITTKDGKRINFLMVVPAYKEEIEYKLKYGMSELDKKFYDNNMPLIIDIHRPNYCADFREVLD